MPKLAGSWPELSMFTPQIYILALPHLAEVRLESLSPSILAHGLVRIGQMEHNRVIHSVHKLANVET
jgi:hypothetical protein